MSKDQPSKPDEQTEPKVVPFPHDTTDEERNRRILAAAEQLASGVPGSWTLWYKERAEKLGIEPVLFADLIKAQIADRERKERNAQAEARLIENRAKRERLTERDHQRDDAAKNKAEMAADRKVEKAAEKEATRQQKEAERKAKEKNKSFANLLKLPVERHENELSKLAKRLGEDLETLRQEFKDFVGVADGFSAVSESDVEPWPEAVDTAELLQAIAAKYGMYVVMQPHQRTGVTLWTAMSWVHNEIATHSPILTVTSAEADSGKTTLLGVLARLVPKPSQSVEANGPNVYRYVDAAKPTLIIDEADSLFTRKTDLTSIINASWTRGTKIPRQVNIGGASVTVFFDPFCPKALGLLGGNLPRTLRTRSIEIRMVPKRPDETVAPFEHVDDFEFAVLRRQLMRWANDNAATLKTMQPTYPPGVHNRIAVNWKVMLAIAELAGGPWPERAREAAQRLSCSGRQPSDRMRLLAAIREMFIESSSKRVDQEITSEDVVTRLNSDPLDIWVAFNKGGRITQRQVAALLKDYEIHPIPLHPTKRKDFGRQGYRFSQFADAFARYLPEHPIIRSPPTAPKRTSSKRAKRKGTRRK